MATKDDILEKFADRLKTLREKTGLTQEEFAYTCNIDRTYIGRLERMERTPSLTILSKIAKGLNMRLKDLFDFD